MPNFATGRGGAGNMRSSSDEQFWFDEQLANQRQGEPVPVYHIGRGGQGNLVKTERRESDASASSKGSECGKRSSLDWVKGLARKA